MKDKKPENKKDPMIEVLEEMIRNGNTRYEESSCEVEAIRLEEEWLAKNENKNHKKN